MTEESCLSLTGVRQTTRYESIVVEYLDKDFKNKKEHLQDLSLKLFNMKLITVMGLLFRKEYSV